MAGLRSGPLGRTGHPEAAARPLRFTPRLVPRRYPWMIIAAESKRRTAGCQVGALRAEFVPISHPRHDRVLYARRRDKNVRSGRSFDRTGCDRIEASQRRKPRGQRAQAPLPAERHPRPAPRRRPGDPAGARGFGRAHGAAARHRDAPQPQDRRHPDRPRARHVAEAGGGGALQVGRGRHRQGGRERRASGHPAHQRVADLPRPHPPRQESRRVLHLRSGQGRSRDLRRALGRS